MKLQSPIQVKAFTTVDEKVFTDELDALKHQLLITFRDMFQLHFNINQGTSVTPSQVAAFISAKGDEINEINQAFKRKVQGYEKRINKGINVGHGTLKVS